MKKKLLRQLLTIMKYSFVGMFLQFLMICVLLANTGKGQNVSIEEIYISANTGKVKLSEAFAVLERSSSLHFIYLNGSILKNESIILQENNKSLGDILRKISKEKKLAFKRINDKIYVKKLKKGSNSIVELLNLKDMQISGKVTDEFDEGLPGVNVVVKGTTIGVVTDAEGKYSLSVPDDATTLVFSYVGYLTEETDIGERAIINISLAPDISKLSEIVVVGYGTQQKREITSAVTSVNAEDFNKGNVNDPNQLLQGKVAGLQIGRVGGNPNQPFTIRLRGFNTIGANAQPLVVIDGIVGGALDAVDPNDIESIEVLKDASAAAIYGTRGSAGVLIVTTKSGSKDGKAQLNYNGYVAFDEMANVIDIATPEEFLQLGGQDLGARTDWLDEVSKTGVSHVHNLSVSNSSNGLNYRLAVNFRDVESIVKNAAEFEQWNARLFLSQKLLDDRLTIAASAAVTTRLSNLGYMQGLAYALTYNPTAPVFENRSATDLNRDPALFGGYHETQVQNRFNPVAINELNRNDLRFNRYVANLRAEYEVIDGLFLSGTYALQRSSSIRGEYNASGSWWGGAAAIGGSATRSAGDDFYEQFDGTVSYSGERNNLSYTVTAGHSYNFFTAENFFAQNTGFITDALLYNNLAAGSGLTADNGIRNLGAGKSEARLSAFFGRLNLVYKNNYFLSASYRREGSSRFGANNRWGNFWALSGGADISRILDLSFFDQLKVRIGYGVNGNLPIQTTAYLSTLSSSQKGFINGIHTLEVGPSSNPNPDLKWEEKAELNVGLDFVLRDSKLSGSFDYFTRTTDDLINTVTVPLGVRQIGSVLANVGEIKTTGVEIQLSYNAVDKNDFKWTVDANFSTAKTRLERWDGTDESQFVTVGGNLGPPGLNGILPIKLAEGEELGQILAQPFQGYDANGAAILQNLDGSETNLINNTQFRVVGNGLPDFSAGLNNTFSYKQWDLNIFLRGTFGHDLVNIQRAYFEHTAVSGRGNIVKTDGFSSEDSQSESYSSRYVEDGSFVKLDNLSIGYNFQLPDGSLFRQIRLYAAGQNLFTITDYLGSDPEVRYFDPGVIEGSNRNDGFSGNDLFPGVDRRVTYLPTRTYTIGVNIGF